MTTPPDKTRDVGYDSVFRPYLSGLSEHRLLIQWCSNCERHQWPGRSLCVQCQSSAITWVDVANRVATVFSWTVVHHAKGTDFEEKVPYAVALVTLENEGVRMYAFIPDFHDLKMGGQVMIDFANMDQNHYPSWRTVDDQDIS